MDSEGPGGYFKVELAMVSWGNLIEPRASVGYYPGEDIQSACGATGVGFCVDVRGQTQLLGQRDEVRTVPFQYCPVPKINLAHNKVVELFLHGLIIGHEAAAQAICLRAQAQV